MDVDNLLAGQRFDIELAKALDACDVLIAIIGPRWMEQLKRRFLVQPSGELARGRPRREHRILPVDDLRRPCREDAAVNR